MLVNASRFRNVQRQLRNEIHELLDGIRSSIRVNGALPPESALLDPEISALHAVWEREFSDTEFDWAHVQSRLLEAASPIRAVEVNSQSSGTLDYTGNRQDGLNVIAVGGFSLSRGLTLEGLMVSYFLRNSMMYDTLMQMGRWFGYRPDYQDLCRIWMPDAAQGWYEHIADSIEELRSELRSMEASNATPEEFGLKVRSHPDSLIVTARNKMGSGSSIVVSIGLASKLIETHTLHRDDESLETNRNAARRLARRLGQMGFPIETADGEEFGFLLRGVPVAPVLDFLSGFRNHPLSMKTEGGPVRRYIEERQDDELAEWDILFASVKEREGYIADDSLGRVINCQQRTIGNRGNTRTLRVSNRQRVSTRGIERSGLTDEQRTSAEKAFQDELERDGRAQKGRKVECPDWAYRKKRTRPLLMIHLIDVQPDGQNVPPDQPVVAWASAFRARIGRSAAWNMWSTPRGSRRASAMSRRGRDGRR